MVTTIDTAVADVLAIDAAPTPLVPQAYIKASNPDAGDSLGGEATGQGSRRMALSSDGSTLAIGAVHEASVAMGINGDQTDNSAIDAGAVYVYVRNGGAWAQQAYVKASNTSGQDLFGYAVAISADGNTLAVGAENESNEGAVFIFTRVGTTWTQQAIVKSTNIELGDGLGCSVSLSSDGSLLAAGAVGEDSASVGNDADNSKSAAGAAYVFVRSGTTWTQQAYIKASNTDTNDLFGIDISLSADATTLVIGALSESSGSATDQADNTANEAGAVYVFARNGTAWPQQAYLKASNVDAYDWFGGSVAVSGDGQTLLIGAGGEDSAGSGINGSGQADNSVDQAGAAYVFARSGSSWSQRAFVKASNTASDQLHASWFGDSVALSSDGTRMVIGAWAEDSASPINQYDTNANCAGAAYAFAFVAQAWSQSAYVKASNPQANDTFGQTVSLSGDGSTLAVGSPGEDSGAAGINGTQLDNSKTDSGAAYVFLL